MKFFTALLSFLLLPSLWAVEKEFWPIQRVHTDAAQGKRVVIKGRTIHKLSHSHFVLADHSSRLVVNKEAVKYRFNKGETIIVMGLYDDSDDYPKYKSEIEAFEIVLPSNGNKIEKFIKKFGYDKSDYEIKDELSEESSTPSSSIEDRLKKLSNLKDKNLITDQEYKEQRKRILDSL